MHYLALKLAFLKAWLENSIQLLSFDIRDKEHSEESKMWRGNRNQTKKYIGFFLKGTKAQVKNRNITTKPAAILNMHKNVQILLL